MLRPSSIAFMLAILASNAPALASDPPTAIDMQEHIFGASNTNAVAGHGALTAGVSSDGDLTVLSWPGPSYTDQLAYIASNALDVRDQPHLGAHDGMGSYLGLRVTTASGDQLVWFRDSAAFTHTQRYTQSDAPVPETTFTSTALGLTVVLTDIVSPDVDVLTRRVQVTRAAGSAVTAASLVLYENISPTLSKLPELPLVDWALDSRNDFLAAYDAANHVVVHFTPGDRGQIHSIGDVLSLKPETTDYGPVDALMQPATPAPLDADVDGLLANLDTSFPSGGVAALVTMEPAPTEFQVGSDATPICAGVSAMLTNLDALSTAFPGFSLPIDVSQFSFLECTDPLPTIRTTRAWTYMPTDALADLLAGTLESSRLAAGSTNAALVTPLVFQNDVAEGTAVFAFGPTLAGARTALATGTSTAAAARQTASEQAAHAVLANVRLPDPKLGPRVTEVALRSLVNVYVARQKTTGAIVAGISRQPPYYLDWPRDGSFFGQGLDVSGLLDFATTRGEWYATLPRTSFIPPDPLLSPAAPTDPDTHEVGFPADAWEMNYFADGTVGGNIRFEIDNTALYIWSTVAHAGALQGSERSAFIAKVWPTLKKGCELMWRWKDAKTGLPAPANEDDHYELTSTLHGATAVYASLVAGARLAYVVKDDAFGDKLLARSKELHAAIIKAYFDDKTGLFRDTQQSGTDYIPGTTGAGSTAWLAWPARLLDADDPRLEAQLAGDLATVMKDIRGETEGGAYVMKNVISAALLGKDGGSRDTARDAVKRLADIATADTSHFGEVFVTTHPNGASAPPVFSARVAPPHVWEGMLFYLSAMALTSPEGFDADIKAFPLPETTKHHPVANPPPGASDGCGCRVGGRDWDTGLGAGFALTLAVAAFARRKRRS